MRNSVSSKFVKLLIAIGMLLLANVLRLVGFILFAAFKIPAFVPTIVGSLLPDVLDMSVCIIIYWPFPLLCCCACIDSNNSTLGKILLPMNYKALFEKKVSVGKMNTPISPSTPTSTSGSSSEHSSVVPVSAQLIPSTHTTEVQTTSSQDIQE